MKFFIQEPKGEKKRAENSCVGGDNSVFSDDGHCICKGEKDYKEKDSGSIDHKKRRRSGVSNTEGENSY